MAKLIAPPVSFFCKGFFLVYTSASYHVRKLAKWIELIFCKLNFQKTYEELVKSVLQLQNLTKGKGKLYKNEKSQVSIERTYVFSYIKS